MNPQRIQLRRQKGFRKPAGAVVVTRSSRWGNPFTIADAIDANHTDPRRAVVSHFTAWLQGHPDYPDVFTVSRRTFDRRWMREHLPELAGRDLACYCSPSDACHADALLEAANGKSS